MSEEKYFPAVSDIETAETVLGEILEPTPMMRNNNLSEKYQADVFLKREDLQIVRSYKIRGAYNKIRSLSPDILKYGIVCASAGNHAQGVAFSCNKLQIMGSIYMPTTTPKQKIEQVKMFGREYIDIVLTGDTFDAANNAAKIKVNQARQKGSQTRNALISELTERYFGLALALQVIEVRKQVVDGMHHHLSDAIALEKNGIIAKGERLYAEVHAAEAEREYLAAQKTANGITCVTRRADRQPPCRRTVPAQCRAAGTAWDTLRCCRTCRSLHSHA